MMKNSSISVPYIPHILPVTRWAASDPHFRSTLVVDEDKAQKPRLSWYHPDDTVRLFSGTITIFSTSISWYHISDALKN